MQDLISHQLVKYLEDRGVEYIFGLCGHTNIAVLTALCKPNARLGLIFLDIKRAADAISKVI